MMTVIAILHGGVVLPWQAVIRPQAEMLANIKKKPSDIEYIDHQIQK